VHHPAAHRRQPAHTSVATECSAASASSKGTACAVTRIRIAGAVTAKKAITEAAEAAEKVSHWH
jgi:hypothetical protein